MNQSWPVPPLDDRNGCRSRAFHLHVPILAGTDRGNPCTAPGAPLHGELEYLVEAGLTPPDPASEIGGVTLPLILLRIDPLELVQAGAGNQPDLTGRSWEIDGRTAFQTGLRA